MIELLLAALFLLATHFGISSTGLRPALTARLGIGAYLGLYSVLAIAAFAWLVSAYSRADYVELWPPATWLAWLALLLMPIPCLLLVAGLTTANPSLVGNALARKTVEPPEGIVRITRHPTMWAFGLWAIIHLIANGDLASLILFGMIAALALVGAVLIDARYRDRLTDAWPSFAGQTSNIPFAAVLADRQQLVVGEIGWWRLALALGLYVLLLALHPLLFGVSPLGAV